MNLLFATCVACQHVLHNLATGDVSNVQRQWLTAMVYSSRPHAGDSSRDK